MQLNPLTAGTLKQVAPSQRRHQHRQPECAITERGTAESKHTPQSPYSLRNPPLAGFDLLTLANHSLIMEKQFDGYFRALQSNQILTVAPENKPLPLPQ